MSRQARTANRKQGKSTAGSGLLRADAVRKIAVSLTKTAPYLTLMVMLIASVFYLKDKQFETVLPVNQVTVKGSFNHLSRSEIEQVVLNNIKGGFFTLDLAAARESLLQKPWVKSVSVRRRWPAELMVDVEEKRAVAYWNQTSLISAQGEVFSPSPMPSLILLPKMYGPEGQHKKVWLFMNRIYQPLAQLDFEVTELKLDERRAWQLVLSDLSGLSKAASTDAGNRTLIVNLGRYETDSRFDRFIRVFASAGGTALRKIAAIDMRYPNGFAVKTKKQKVDHAQWSDEQNNINQMASDNRIIKWQLAEDVSVSSDKKG